MAYHALTRHDHRRRRICTFAPIWLELHQGGRPAQKVKMLNLLNDILHCPSLFFEVDVSIRVNAVRPFQIFCDQASSEVAYGGATI